MTEQELIEAFKKKQGFENGKQMDDSTWRFDGMYFDIRDIRYDIDEGAPVGKIKLYASEEPNISYREWLHNYFGF